MTPEYIWIYVYQPSDNYTYEAQSAHQMLLLSEAEWQRFTRIHIFFSPKIHEKRKYL